MKTDLEMHLSIQFDSEHESQIVFTSLQPEIQEHDFDRSKVSITQSNRKIVIYISAQDLNAAKATINSVLRWISTASEVISTFSKQT
ncbi:MAG: KEOPS complex subunit Pcc1 [Candidatus Hodarchaeales archaeon]|jgi:tRNA threonylcarbamoyladenosine modification (KEOPS) complex  Pcc1 subunit